MKNRKKIIKTVLLLIGIYIVCLTAMAIANHIYIRPTLAGTKAFAMNSFNESPEKMAAFKKTPYYTKITNATTMDSVEYYFHQYLQDNAIK